MISSAHIRTLAEQPGTVILDFPERMLLHSPIESVVARSIDEVLAAIVRLDQAVRDGKYIAGYLAYEAGYAFETSLKYLSFSLSEPLIWFGIYNQIHSFGDLPSPEPERLLNAAFGIDRALYTEQIKRIRDYIARGDTYQVNFTDALTFSYSGTPFDLFLRLRSVQEVKYSAYLNIGGHAIASLSPELFFRLEGRNLTMKPMKGTAPRGRTTVEDREVAAWLASDEKNRAENVMIVDLIRNDMGRICETGSIAPKRLFEVERYATIHQLTSTVEGRLRPEVGLKDLLRAIFPSGSVTGAPKIRTMQIIHELERNPRGVYTGAIGYFGPQAAEMNVAIRTAVLQAGKGHVGVGSGITYESVAENEYDECLWKARFLSAQPQEFRLIETMRWDGSSYHALDLHIARLKDSTEYFAFACDESQVRGALCAYSAHLTGPARVRLTLDRSGELQITHASLPTPFARVALAAKRVSSSDRFLFHKTTNRALYNYMHVAAQRQGLDDVLFFNERGELTEGCIHNVVLNIGERLFTPKLDCGLLPGTERARLLASGEATERVLRLEDLKAARKVLLCNSVRGVYEVAVEFVEIAAED